MTPEISIATIESAAKRHASHRDTLATLVRTLNDQVEAIKRAAKRAGTRSKEVAVAISGDAAITKVIQMPRSLSERELEAQVELQADQYIPFPMEEVSYDF